MPSDARSMQLAMRTAYASGTCSRNAPENATDGRDERTNGDGSATSNPATNASHAGGPDESGRDDRASDGSGVLREPRPRVDPLNVLSLFAGIGGLDLGLERAGMRVVGQVEIDPYCRRVLAKHWPDVPQHDDVRTAVDWWMSEQRPRVDVVCGGYPCQPFSTAGKMLASEDPRHLWPAFADVLAELRPRYALLENVPAHLGLGLDQVLADLASLGFDAEWSIVPASAVGAPQRRPRLFVLAYPEGAERQRRRRLSAVSSRAWPGSVVADVHRCRAHSGGQTDTEPWVGEPGVRRMGDGIPGRLDRLRLHALGNAVVPQVAEYVGRLIVEHARECAA